jgi:endonuclease/exonuclease/phosphatase (EEP) superfamily protein YafD
VLQPEACTSTQVATPKTPGYLCATPVKIKGIFPFVRGCLRWIPALLLALLAFTALGNLAGSEFGPLARTVHFAPYWSLLALALVFWFACRRRWRLMSCGALLAIGFGGQVGALWVAPKPAAAGSVDEAPSSISFMSFNVFAHNRRYSDVVSALRAARPDVLYLTELNAQWHRAVSPLLQDYPHRLVGGSNMLLSMLPLENTRRVPLNFETAQSAIRASGAMPPLDESLRDEWWKLEVLTATVVAGGKHVRVAGVHPPTPRSSLRILMQRAMMLVSQQELQADPRADARVLLGDFNTTCFSPTFRFILERTGLRDSAQGFGYAPTWGPRLPRDPWLPWLGIPIDHVLVSPGVEVVEREVGPALGSDHRWVKVKLGL